MLDPNSVPRQPGSPRPEALGEFRRSLIDSTPLQTGPTHPATPAAGRRVALFASAYAKQVQNVELDTVLHSIFGGKYAQPIARLRELAAAWRAVCPKLDT